MAIDELARSVTSPKKAVETDAKMQEAATRALKTALPNDYIEYAKRRYFKVPPSSWPVIVVPRDAQLREVAADACRIQV